MTTPASDQDPAIAPSALTYVELWRGAELLIRKAGEEQSGSRWVFLSVLMLLSFCLEAYLNHAGPLLFGAAWNEGRQPHRDKEVKARLRLVCAACGVTLAAPCKYRTVALTLLELRESLGHATQVRLAPPGVTPSRHPPTAHRTPPSWRSTRHGALIASAAWCWSTGPSCAACWPSCMRDCRSRDAARCRSEA